MEIETEGDTERERERERERNKDKETEGDRLKVSEVQRETERKIMGKVNLVEIRN